MDQAGSPLPLGILAGLTSKLVSLCVPLQAEIVWTGYDLWVCLCFINALSCKPGKAYFSRDLPKYRFDRKYGRNSSIIINQFYPRGHSITKHTGRGGGLARRSESKPPKYLSKNTNIRKMLKSYPLNILRYNQRLAIWDNFSFSLRIVPPVIHMKYELF